jgi:hypothetical protein
MSNATNTTNTNPSGLNTTNTGATTFAPLVNNRDLQPVPQPERVVYKPLYETGYIPTQAPSVPYSAWDRNEPITLKDAPPDGTYMKSSVSLKGMPRAIAEAWYAPIKPLDLPAGYSATSFRQPHTLEKTRLHELPAPSLFPPEPTNLPSIVDALPNGRKPITDDRGFIEIRKF